MSVREKKQIRILPEEKLKKRAEKKSGKQARRIILRFGPQMGQLKLRTTQAENFTFLGALEHLDGVYVVLSAENDHTGHEDELLLLRLSHDEQGKTDYDVVQDPVEAYDVFERYVSMALEARLEEDFDGISEADDWEEAEQEFGILH